MDAAGMRSLAATALAAAAGAALFWRCMRFTEELRIAELEDRVAELTVATTDLAEWDHFMRELWNSREMLRALIHPQSRHAPLFERPPEGSPPVNLYFVALEEVDEAGVRVLRYRRVQQGILNFFRT